MCTGEAFEEVSRCIEERGSPVDVLHAWHISSLGALWGTLRLKQSKGFLHVFSQSQNQWVMVFTVLCSLCWGRREEKRMGKKKGAAMSRT